MSIPSTLGNLRTRIQDMQIGDYIVARYKSTLSTIYGTISEIGTSVLAELPYTPVSNPDGTFYFIKADKGLLIADRNVHLMAATACDTNGVFYNGLASIDLGINFNGGTFLVNESTKDAMKVTSSSTNANNVTYSPGRAFGATGGTDADRWLSDTNLNQWLKIDLGRQELLGAYSLMSTYNTAQPKTFKFYGSNDDTTWNLLDDVPVSNMTSVNVSFVFSINTTQVYRYYKWEFTNNYGYTGYKYDLADVKLYKNEFNANGILRVLDGGAIYANQYGLKNDVFNVLYGVTPTNNEWEKYIVKSDLGGKIVAGDDNVWHWSNKESWTINFWNDYASALAPARVLRGGTTANKISYSDSSVNTNYYGYRPVFEYVEV